MPVLKIIKILGAGTVKPVKIEAPSQLKFCLKWTTAEPVRIEPW